MRFPGFSCDFCVHMDNGENSVNELKAGIPIAILEESTVKLLKQADYTRSHVR